MSANPLDTNNDGGEQPKKPRLYYDDPDWPWAKRMPPEWDTKPIHNRAVIEDILKCYASSSGGERERDRFLKAAAARMNIDRECLADFEDEQKREKAEAKDRGIAEELKTLPEIVRLARIPDGTEFDAAKKAILDDAKEDGRPITSKGINADVKKVREHLGLGKQKKKSFGPLFAVNKERSWSEGLYHIRHHNGVIRYGMKTPWTVGSFNGEFAIKDPRGGNGTPITPFVYVSRIVGFKETVDNAAYAAGLPEVFEFAGKSFINLYHPSDAPETAAEYSEDGEQYVKTVRDHLLLMVRGNKEHALMIESWMALNVREPGRVIGWAPLIKGVPGDGKSVIFDKMMRGVLGAVNVGLVNSKEIKTDFNPWAYGKAYRHIAELKAAGLSRYEVEDAVKVHITDPVVRMIGKGDNGDEIPNRTNYAATTNHDDAIPLNDTDRRWGIFFTPWTNLDEMAEVIVNMDAYFEEAESGTKTLKPAAEKTTDEKAAALKAYFDRLHEAAENGGPWLRKYFLEMDLHKDVHHDSRAPITEFKKDMARAEFDYSGGDQFDEWIENGGGYGMSSSVVLLKVLVARLAKSVGRDAPRAKHAKSLLESRGFVKIKRSVKWRGMVKSGVYISDKKLAARANAGAVADELANVEIRRMLDATIPKEDLQGKDINDNETVKAFDEQFFKALERKGHEF